MRGSVVALKTGKQRMPDSGSACVRHEHEFDSSRCRPDAFASEGSARKNHFAGGANNSRYRWLPAALRGLAMGAAVWLALPGTSAFALTPPEPFVLAADGVTKLTLEQAGILKPDGRKWALVLGKALFW